MISSKLDLLSNNLISHSIGITDNINMGGIVSKSQIGDKFFIKLQDIWYRIQIIPISVVLYLSYSI
jgi:hypothetical protein